MSFADEMEAFRVYQRLFGERTVLLIDTYDTIAAARRIVESDLRPPAVRIDSGDLPAVIRAVRAVFDAGGLRATRILASGDLDEDRVAELLAADVPVDGFGVGTAVSTSKDAPALGGIYKLVEVERGGQWVPVLKRSPGKHAYPGRKQVWRIVDRGQAVHDVIGLDAEAPPADAVPLLVPVMSGGRRLAAARPLMDLRETCLRAVSTLPPGVRRLRQAEPYPVHVTPALRRLTDEVLRSV